MAFFRLPACEGRRSRKTERATESRQKFSDASLHEIICISLGRVVARLKILLAPAVHAKERVDVINAILPVHPMARKITSDFCSVDMSS